MSGVHVKRVTAHNFQKIPKPISAGSPCVSLRVNIPPGMEGVVALPLLTNQVESVIIIEEISGWVLSDTETRRDLGIQSLEISKTPRPVLTMSIRSGNYHFVVHHTSV